MPHGQPSAPLEVRTCNMDGTFGQSDRTVTRLSKTAQEPSSKHRREETFTHDCDNDIVVGGTMEWWI